jgi:hypothetical protein
MLILSLHELQEYAPQIIERINASHNGGLRFLVHPLRMLRDLDVELSEKALAELVRLEPKVSMGSDAAYEALLSEEGRSNIEVVIDGDRLFREAARRKGG